MSDPPKRRIVRRSARSPSAAATPTTTEVPASAGLTGRQALLGAAAGGDVSGGRGRPLPASATARRHSAAQHADPISILTGGVSTPAGGGAAEVTFATPEAAVARRRRIVRRSRSGSRQGTPSKAGGAHNGSGQESDEEPLVSRVDTSNVADATPAPSVVRPSRRTQKRDGSAGPLGRDIGATTTTAAAAAASASGSSSSINMASSSSALGRARGGPADDTAGASTTLSAPPPMAPIDEAVFATVAFSAPTFVNNVSNRMLFPLLSRHRARQKQLQQLSKDARGANSSTTGGGGGGGGIGIGDMSAGMFGASTSMRGGGGGGGGEVVRASDGKALFARVGLKDDGLLETTDYHRVANDLSVALESAAAQVEALLARSDAALRQQEVRCKRVEIREKRRLAEVRMGLEETSARLQEYENRVSNAQAATAGIEQHLAQSNARVLRGKSVSQLLKYFKMFTAIAPPELSGLLKALSKARIGQREAVKAAWARGRVSAFNPKFYTLVTGGDGDDGAGGGGRNGRRGGAENDDNNDDENDDDDGGDSDSSTEDSEAAEADLATALKKVKLHRAEAAAVAAGLDTLFAARRFTEQQVDWCQRLALLATELREAASNTKNIDAYVTWLRQELVSDLFFIITCFNDFYEQNPQTAVHMSYGRAMRKTLELIARLYTTLTPSSDSLMSVFFSQAINNLAVAMYSEYAPRPLPNQPPLPNISPLLAMDHYHKNTEVEITKAFQFLADRIRRDVIVVETIFGITSTTRQQLLSQVTEGVVKPFVTQQMILARTHENAMRSGEANLSPRAKRRCAARVADAIAYSHTMEVKLYVCFQDLIQTLKAYFEQGEVEFLHQFAEAIFTNRQDYSKGRAELELLQRYYTIIEERYTRQLHPLPDQLYQLREAHMSKAREMIECANEVCNRVRTYALPKEAGAYVFELVTACTKAIGSFLEVELRKMNDCMRQDRDKWRLRPKTEDELLKPSTPESQQCGFRMLLFAQSTLMSLSDSVAVLCMPLLPAHPRLVQDIEGAKMTALEPLDDEAERLLNMCAQAVIIRSLAILPNYQVKTDYQPRALPADAVVPPCTRACTLFCYYLTRQLEECKAFIQLSSGQQPQKQTASQIATGATLQAVVSQRNAAAAAASPLSPAGSPALASPAGSPGANTSTTTTTNNNNNTAYSNTGGFASAVQGAVGLSGVDAVRARARTMNLQQLLYGDGGPSSFTRTIGVCLYRGIAAHLKTFVVNDHGALIYKQDVTAYKESVAPLTATPGLGGAVVETLFQLLKETSSLLIMPLDHIKEVKASGLLRLMPHEEQMRFIKMRRDVRDAYKIINQ